MPLSGSRNTTYVAGVSQVKSLDLNQIQDCIVQGAHGDKTLLIPAAAFYAEGDDPDIEFLTTGAASVGWVSSTTGDYIAEAPIILHAGDRIKSVRVYLKEGNLAGEEIVAKIWESKPTAPASRTQKGPTKTSGITGAEASQTFQSPDADFPLTLTDEHHYIIAVTIPQTSGIAEAVLYGARVVYDHPLV